MRDIGLVVAALVHEKLHTHQFAGGIPQWAVAQGQRGERSLNHAAILGRSPLHQLMKLNSDSFWMEA